MARKAPPISVKDLTAALAIGKDQGREEALVAERSSPYIPFNRENNPSAYGDDTIEDEPGTDPAEMIQLELPLDLVNKLKIMADENPEIAQGIASELMIAHGGHTPETTYDDYGRPENIPRYKGGNPGGKQIEIPWMKEEYEKKHPELEQLHFDKYHQAKVNYGTPSALDKYFQEHGYPNRDMPKEERLKIMRGSLKKADASNNIKSLSPYKVVPPLDVPAPPGGRRLEDRLLGLPPGWNKA